jgi:Rps23 Pro-64 3,4-dihydroxylase Tpa1-like proline 4-hydroxylase
MANWPTGWSEKPNLKAKFALLPCTLPFIRQVHFTSAMQIASINKHTGTVTFVFYLNNKWFSGDCGDLVIYRPKKPTVTIAPTGGALAIFMHDLEHEVLLANAPRYSLTG